MGKVRPEDRLQADLNLNEALAQQWGDDFQENFMDRLGVSRLFRPGPAPDTVGELLSFVQQELDDWRAAAAKGNLASEIASSSGEIQSPEEKDDASHRQKE